MTFWDPFTDNLEIFAILFRIILVAFGLMELYRFTKKRQDLDEIHSWRPKPMQEAMTNLFMIGLFIFVFILVIYFDYMSWSSYNTRGEYGWVYIPIDLILGIFIISLYLYPKRFVIAMEGFFYSGELTAWEDVIDYEVMDRRGILAVRHWRKLFKFNFRTETQVPLPEDRKVMKDALDVALGKKKDKKKLGSPKASRSLKDESFEKGKKGRKKDLEDEDEDEDEDEKPRSSKKSSKKELAKKKQLLLTDGKDKKKKGKGKKKGSKK